MEIKYIAEPTLSKFHKSDAFYRGIRGPVRSGKSTGCSVEIMNRARKQAPGTDHIRRSRCGVVRNTYRELEDTTLRTWLMWFPEYVFGHVNRRTMTHTIQFNDIYLEVLFRALDRPDDVAKLLSMELSFAWTNETREIPKVIIDVLGDRVEQYPPKMEGGCSWGGVFMDTNSPDEDHWWAELEANPPKGWEFFSQPGALKEIKGKFVPNPRAENVRNLKGGHGYYLKRMEGKKESYIRVYYCNQFGFAEDGKRVHPDYVDSVHCSPSAIVPNPKDPVVIGLDYGLTPAAAFFSRRPNGQWLMFHEIATEDIGVKKFGERLLLPYILKELMDFDFEIFEDPYGNTASQTDKKTPSQILETLGLRIKTPNMAGGPNIRREALDSLLGRMIDGEPGLLVDPRCRVFRKGMSSKYVYRRIQVAGDERYHEKPEKNFWSHICEAAQHAMVGGGEGKAITRRKPKDRGRVIQYPMDRSRNGWMAA